VIVGKSKKLRGVCSFVFTGVTAILLACCRGDPSPVGVLESDGESQTESESGTDTESDSGTETETGSWIDTESDSGTDTEVDVTGHEDTTYGLESTTSTDVEVDTNCQKDLPRENCANILSRSDRCRGL
jgi:hypothetical protein